MEDWHNFGADYDTTLMAWHERFINAGQRLRAIITSALNVCSAIISMPARVRFAHVISSFGRWYLRAALKTVCAFLANHRPAFHAGILFPLANVGLISDRIFSRSQYAFYGIDNRLRLRIDLDIHTLTQFFCQA